MKILALSIDGLDRHTVLRRRPRPHIVAKMSLDVHMDLVLDLGIDHVGIESLKDRLSGLEHNTEAGTALL